MTLLDESAIDPAVAYAAQEPNDGSETYRLFALKHGDCFVVADTRGDIAGRGDGFFHDDTRILSRFSLKLGGLSPMLLGSSLSHDNILFFADSANPPITKPNGVTIPHGVVHIERSRVLWANRLYERIVFAAFGDRDVELPVSIGFGADFRDMFEVRGSSRPARGRVREPDIATSSVTLCYEGLDGVTRQSTVSFSDPPRTLSADTATFEIALPKRSRRELYVEVGSGSATQPSLDRFRRASANARLEMRRKRRASAAIQTSGRVFNEWLSRSLADTNLLTTELATGPYPYAGIPWFSTIFGRDGIISALQLLWLNPRVARGVLAFLALHQATETAPFTDAEPGKILHERRRGEMTSLRELPFGHYYGSIDTTPLFIYLAAAYADRTGDLGFIEELWPALCAAARWMEAACDEYGDGFVKYQRAASSGLANQGWKDSVDSIHHADGRLARGPIALVEVQGYVYAAFRGLAGLATRRGETDLAAGWTARSEAIRQLVEDRFWMEDQGFYALAIDGEDKPCRVRASNPGHLLFVGLPSAERAQRVAEQMQSAPFYSGWGIRTLAETEVSYNPMSYHNGSVWPHDTAICAAGLARYGVRDAVTRMMSDMFEAAVRFHLRLPELFCGFPRVLGRGPIAYPVACLPQAWSAGSVFMMLQSCLGIEVNGWNKEIHISHPRLPIGIDNLQIHGLMVGGSPVSLALQRMGDRVIAESYDTDAGRIPIITRS